MSGEEAMIAAAFVPSILIALTFAWFTRQTKRMERRMQLNAEAWVRRESGRVEYLRWIEEQS